MVCFPLFFAKIAFSDSLSSSNVKTRLTCHTYRPLQYFREKFYAISVHEISSVSYKGQLISKCLFGVFNPPQKTNENNST